MVLVTFNPPGPRDMPLRPASPGSDMTDITRPQARPEGLPAEEAQLRPLGRPEGLGEGPAEVAEAATTEGTLPLFQATLIGLFTGPSGGTALVRLATGDVVRATTGDVVAGGVVTSIADGSMHLWRDGAEEILTIPA